MLSYFIDYNRERFEEKTFMDMVDITRHVAEWYKNQTPKSLSQIEKLILKNRKLQDLLKKNINTRDYEKLYFAKKFSNIEDVPEMGDVLRREEMPVYAWTYSQKFAVTISDYSSGHKKPNSAGIVASAKSIKNEEVVLDVYHLLKFIEEIFSEVDETDLKTFLKKVQGDEYDKDTVTDFLWGYHSLEGYAKEEQPIFVSGNNKNNKCVVIATFKHEDGIFKEEGWNTLSK